MTIDDGIILALILYAGTLIVSALVLAGRSAAGWLRVKFRSSASADERLNLPPVGSLSK
jgi:hypothetical protein